MEESDEAGGGLFERSAWFPFALAVGGFVAVVALALAVAVVCVFDAMEAKEE